MRTGGTIVGLACRLLSMLSACGADETRPAGGVIFEVRGGIAGFYDRLVIERSGQAELSQGIRDGPPAKFQLSRREIEMLRSLLAESDFENLDSDYSSATTVMDDIHYRIEYAGRTVELDGSAAPIQLGPVIGFLSELVVKHR